MTTTRSRNEEKEERGVEWRKGKERKGEKREGEKREGKGSTERTGKVSYPLGRVSVESR